MGKVENLTLGEVRKEAYEFWRNETGRKTYKIGEEGCIFESFECRWQSFIEKQSEVQSFLKCPSQCKEDNCEMHNSFFCSLGNFAQNIDDLLKDERFDNLNLSRTENHEHASPQSEAILRFYQKILLFLESVLDDFALALKSIGKKKLPKEILKFKGFLNTLIKHKTGKNSCFNFINHHLHILFENSEFLDNKDGNVLSNENNTLSISNFGKAKEAALNFEYFKVPGLIESLEFVVEAYEFFDGFFNFQEMGEAPNESFLEFLAKGTICMTHNISVEKASNNEFAKHK